jgi:hypothetical protein
MGPVRTWLKSWFDTPTTPDPVPPADVVAPDPEIDPAVPAIEPSRVQLVNYIRALLILRNTPFKELRDEFLKLPLKKIAYAIGTVIWLFMSYTFLKHLLGL